MMGLWSIRWSTASGYTWKHERDCDVDNARAWLAVFQDDEPDIHFALRDKKPTKSELYKITGWKPL